MQKNESSSPAEALQNSGEFDIIISEILLAHKNRLVPGFSYGDYHLGRSSDGIVFCVSGEGAFVYKDKTILLHEGEYMFLSRNGGYTVRSSGSEPFVHYTVNFIISDLRVEDSSLYLQILSGKERFVTSSRPDGEVLRLFERLLSEWQSKRDGYHLSAKGILYSILYDYLTAARRDARNESAYSVLRPAKKVLDSSASLTCTGAELAALCSVSEAHFRRLWKKQFGTTPTEYNRRRRLMRAKDLLLSGVYTVKEAAAEVGYDDANYFSRVFRREFGLSPTEFMR